MTVTVEPGSASPSSVAAARARPRHRMPVPDRSAAGSGQVMRLRLEAICAGRAPEPETAIPDAIAGDSIRGHRERED